MPESESVQLAIDGALGVTPRPGDVIVATAPSDITSEVAMRISDRLREAFPRNQVVVMSEGFRLNVRHATQVAIALGFEQAECRFCGVEPPAPGDESFASCLDGYPHHYLWDAAPLKDPAPSRAVLAPEDDA